MATINFYAAMDMRFLLNSGTFFHDNIGGGTATTHTATSYVVRASGGMREDRFGGTGLGNTQNNLPTSGQVTSWSHFVNFGSGLTKTWDFSGFTVAASTFSDGLINDNFGPVLGGLIMAGNDIVKGSNLDDYLIGFGGDDQITGNGGNDTLDGGSGKDKLTGGAGDDVYIVDNSGDVVTEASGAGTDTVYLSMSAGGVFYIPTNVENAKSVMTIGMAIVGSAVGNVLSGANNVADNLYGLDGNDILAGGYGGNDRMYGGAGNDIFYVDVSTDFVSDDKDSSGVAGSGVDEVRALLSYSLNDPERLDIENITSVTSTGVELTGNALANVITGNSGADRLDGLTGADTMRGGAGDDIYVVENSGDKVIENALAGSDLVLANRTWTLSANVEKLTLTGTAAIKAFGNDLVNTLVGNGAANVLDGKAGADFMAGGGGNDTYVVDNGLDSITEAAGGGSDLVTASVNFSLPVDVERLTLLGTADLRGTGNAAVNVVNGNSGANVILGLDGNDTLNGQAGNDTLDGGAGSDRLTGGAGQDQFLFNSAIVGTINRDTIMDFNLADDTIVLDLSYFTKLGPAGTLGAGAFYRGTAAHDADDRIVLNTATGALYYDGDGNGPGAAILFAHVTAGLMLTNLDFMIVT